MITYCSLIYINVQYCHDLPAIGMPDSNLMARRGSGTIETFKD